MNLYKSKLLFALLFVGVVISSSVAIPAFAECTDVCSDLDGDGTAETCIPVCKDEEGKPAPDPDGPSVPDVGPSGPVEE